MRSEGPGNHRKVRVAEAQSKGMRGEEAPERQVGWLDSGADGSQCSGSAEGDVTSHWSPRQALSFWC